MFTSFTLCTAVTFVGTSVAETLTNQ